MGRWRLTPFGAAFIVIVAACIVVFCFATGAARVLAGGLGCVLLPAMAGEGMGNGLSSTDAARKQEVLRGQARPRRRSRWRR
jgi:hypothetical protein